MPHGFAMVLVPLLLVVLLVALLLVWGPARLKANATLAVDLLDLVRLLMTVKVKAASVRNKDWSVVDMFEECVAAHGDNAAFTMVEPKETVTYSELDCRSNQVAHWALRQRLRQGDTIALVMHSCPDYVAMWLGMAKVGVATGLVNAHTKGPSLVHAIQAVLRRSERKLVVVGRDLAPALLVPEVRAELGQEVRIVLFGAGHLPPAASAAPPPAPASAAAAAPAPAADTPGLEGLDDVWVRVRAMPRRPVRRDLRQGIRWDSTLFYVYTSGTTGLPKASRITHMRFWSAAALFSITARLRPEDRVYCALPLYHSNGGMLGVGGCWRAGCTLVVRRRFSVNQFAPDCVLYRCTVMQYIGEVARYLVNSRPSPLDKQCRLRVAFGNGLRLDVWGRFQERFGIPRVVEFYASTEGNANMVNNTGRVGAVGVVPWFVPDRLYPVRLLRVDPDTDGMEGLLRNGDGLCVPCQAGEVGQLLGLINDRDPSRCFDGYTDRAATAKKVVRGVLRQGDTWFASGDLFRRDSFGFYYWVDRVGDTFRWKGENVATTEVAQVVCGAKGVADVNVYGVEVPGAEGRAGMAMIKLRGGVTLEDLDWEALFAHLDVNLPSYAQPSFVRVQARPKLTDHMTTTFKHVKTLLRQEGFDPARAGGDTVRLRDPVARTFVPLTPELLGALKSGRLRL